MAKVTYVPADGEAASVTWAGQKFEANKAVEVSNPLLLAKARNNPQFKVAAASKEETRQAEIVGGFADANTGQPVEIVRVPRAPTYGVLGTPDPRPVPPSTATQGSTAIEASRPVGGAENPEFERTFGATQAEVASGEYEGAPEYLGPEGTEGVEGKPAKASARAKR